MLVALAGWGWHAYHRPRPSVATQQVEASLSASTLFSEFQADEKTASGKYLDRVLAVSGRVEAIDSSGGQQSILLETGGDGSINCLLFQQVAAPEKLLHRHITIKGKCTGFLLDVSLVDCILE